MIYEQILSIQTNLSLPHLPSSPRPPPTTNFALHTATIHKATFPKLHFPNISLTVALTPTTCRG